ncbi:MAG: polysaccharide deacetylase family protein [Opitutaceae bacterium]|nr:polysaccharide deacetylase family protein [Opitutaceae bacterium]
MISFTFDDFPHSALVRGGAALAEHGLAATYYTAFGLAGHTIETGRMFDPADIARLVRSGHELGCHTYDHCPAWETPATEYLASVRRNAAALSAELGDGATFASHSYPISYPRPAAKRRLARIFRGCRFGGQTSNIGTVDLNCIASFFLEQCGEDLGAIERLVGEITEHGGWLIFSTHDVDVRPTRYGCTPAFFESVVGCAVRSGVPILPVGRALADLGAGR